MSRLPLRRSAVPTACAVSLVLLAACAGPGPVPPATPAPPAVAPPAPATAAEQRTAAAAALTVEQQWLDSFFRGTPVSVRQQDDGTLAVDVPREFCFDAGRSSIKPPLAAVLDKVAESLRRRPGSTLALISAPEDAAGGTALAMQRAGQVHKHLRDRGVPAARLGEPRAASGAAVQLRIVAQPG